MICVVCAWIRLNWVKILLLASHVWQSSEYRICGFILLSHAIFTSTQDLASEFEMEILRLS